MQHIFLWFYCLSISDSILITLLATLFYFLMRRYLAAYCFWEPLIVFLCILYIFIIAFGTLADRMTFEIQLRPALIPFHSYRAVMSGENIEILRSNFMNVVLFYPTGLLACELLPKTWKRYRKILLIALVFALLSTGIEICQYRFALGQAEVDDVMHNTLGALIGAVVCTIRIPWHKLKSCD